uniref:ORF5 n=1 Tax=Malaco herpesvirus 4 TaxID=3031800 RepID=A0AA48P8X8_9VIRU|nr:TPA_asm: ORF5 [Malaco herpesvirus 4]
MNNTVYAYLNTGYVNKISLQWDVLENVFGTSDVSPTNEDLRSLHASISQNSSYVQVFTWAKACVDVIPIEAYSLVFYCFNTLLPANARVPVRLIISYMEHHKGMQKAPEQQARFTETMDRLSSVLPNSITCSGCTPRTESSIEFPRLLNESLSEKLTRLSELTVNDLKREKEHTDRLFIHNDKGYVIIKADGDVETIHREYLYGKRYEGKELFDMLSFDANRFPSTLELLELLDAAFKCEETSMQSDDEKTGDRRRLLELYIGIYITETVLTRDITLMLEQHALDLVSLQHIESLLRNALMFLYPNATGLVNTHYMNLSKRAVDVMVGVFAAYFVQRDTVSTATSTDITDKMIEVAKKGFNLFAVTNTYAGTILMHPDNILPDMVITTEEMHEKVTWFHVLELLVLMRITGDREVHCTTSVWDTRDSLPKLCVDENEYLGRFVKDIINTPEIAEYPTKTLVYVLGGNEQIAQNIIAKWPTRDAADWLWLTSGLLRRLTVGNGQLTESQIISILCVIGARVASCVYTMRYPSDHMERTNLYLQNASFNTFREVQLTGQSTGNVVFCETWDF